MKTVLDIQIKKLDPEVESPRYAYEGDAGLDLRSAEDVTIKPFERHAVPTGLAIAIPEGYAGFVQPRSGLSLKQGLTVVNTPGLIDSNYRGELKIAVINVNPDKDIEVHRGDRIAQLVIVPVPVVHLREVDELDDTCRGANGFGSSAISG